MLKINSIVKMKCICTSLSQKLNCHTSVHFQTVFTLLSIQSSFLLMQRKKLGISITKTIIDQQNGDNIIECKNCCCAVLLWQIMFAMMKSHHNRSDIVRAALSIGSFNQLFCCNFWIFYCFNKSNCILICDYIP